MQFGVDEAGKGPVLGSMFAAAVVADPETLPSAVADSKTLTPERRDELAAALEADPAVEIGVAEVPVDRIDDPETDMNTLTVVAQAEALSAVEATGLTGYVDAGDTNADRFGARVATRVPGDVTVHAEHAADETYPIVAAASIIAKVERDTHIEALGATYEADIGSGYPSDPTTREFLETYLEKTGTLPECARESWQTSKDVLGAAEQTGLADF
jgi:ribonuclease HII